MIAQLEGTIADISSDSAVISASGIGFAVHMSSPDIARLHIGSHARIYTHLVVSQDAVSLYGFCDKRAKDLFLNLQKVSGVGPKAALAFLSALSVDQLIDAISNQDVTALTRAKGVGKRVAQKVILELSGKIATVNEEKVSVQTVPRNIAHVIDGLVSLGWHSDEVRAAVDEVTTDLVDKSTGDIPDDQVPQVLRAALTTLGRRMQ